jgi:subtilisin family serine protease
MPTHCSVQQRNWLVSLLPMLICCCCCYALQDASGYRELSGTSMAAPHVAGVAANCMMAGACAQGTGGLATLATLQGAARERLAANAQYGFAGDGTSTINGKFFGLLAWAKW